MNIKRQGFIVVILAAFTMFFEVPMQAQNSLLWEISAPNGNTSYIFGTYHLIGSDYLADHPKVAEAYASAEKVVVETVIDSSKLMEVAAMSVMQNQTLWDFYDTAQFELINTEFSEVTGMPLTSMTQLKPVAIAMFYSLSIAQQELVNSGLNFSGQPIDVYFAGKGRRSGKEVISLETMMEQMEMLYNSDSLEEQAKMLLTLMEDSTVTDISVTLLEYYEEEDIEAMAKLADETGDDYGDMAVLLDNRNNKWIEKLEPVLDEGNAFIAVGALHLPGREGLIQLLKDRGFEIRPVTGP